MKNLSLLSIVFICLALGQAAGAANVVKENNTTALNVTGSWVGAALPGGTDVAVWDTPFAQAAQITFGSLNQSWAGIKVLAPTVAPSIRSSSGYSLTLGGSGIDMANATQNFTIGQNVTAGANQAWNIGESRVLVLSNGIAGAGVRITKSGNGSLRLAGATAHSPDLQLDAGTLNASPASGTQVLSGGLSGAGGALLKDAAGALTLSGNNSAFSGDITLGAGQLNLNHASALGTGVFVIAGGILDNTSGSPLILTGDAPLAWNGDFSFTGTSNLDLSDTAVIMAGNRSVTVNGGTLGLGGSVTGGTGSSLTKLGAGTLETTTGASIDLEGKIAIGGGTLKITNGLVACGSSNGNVEISGGGSVELTGGTLSARSINRTGATATFRFQGGTLMARADSSTFISGLDAAYVAAGGARVGIEGWFVTIPQPLLHDPALGVAADGGLRLSDSFGGGKLTLTGASTYTGPTLVEGGTLVIGPGGSIAASPLIELGPNGTLDAMTGASIASGQMLQGTGTVVGALTIAPGGTLSPAGTGRGTMIALDSLVLNGTADFQIHKAGGTRTSDRVTGTLHITYGGTLNVTATGDTLAPGDSFKLFDAASYSGGFTTLVLSTLPAGLFWETTGLLVDGSIKVVDTLPTPGFSPPSGGYMGAQSVTIYSASGTTIHYTVDGSNPVTSGTALSGPSPIEGVVVPTDSASFTIKAYATKAGATSSPVGSAVYNTLSTPTWTFDGDGDWSDSSNWRYGVVASGGGISADFSTLTLTGNTAVTLDSPRTIGGLKFGDVGNAVDWTVQPAGGAVLTLEKPGGAPEIHVANRTTTISAVVAGTQGLEKTGTGLLALTGSNTYTGPITVREGELSQSANPAGPITVNTGAVYRAKTGGGAGIFAGTGKLILSGIGNSVDARLMDPNSIVAVQINGDWLNSNSGVNWQSTVMILEVPDGYGFDVGSNDLIQCAGMIGGGNFSTRWGSGGNDTLRFVGTGNYTFNGTIGYTPYSGGVHLVQNGTGKQILAGNVYANNVAIGSGATLQFGINNAATIQMDAGYSMVNNGTLIFNWSSANTLACVISGSGALLKDGTGTLVLSANHTYTGTTTVNAGGLMVNGSLGAGSAVTVAADGTLGGTGTVTGTVTAAGALAPGAGAAGTLATGAVTLAGTYQCQLDGASADQLAVTGNLDLTGSALVVSTISPQVPGTYVIATFTGSRTGEFTSVTAGYTVDYGTPNQVKLVVSGSGDPYQSWVGGFGLTGNNALSTADPDLDGIANSVEFVLGGNPAGVQDQNLLPTITLVTNPGGTVPAGDYLRFTYRRVPASAYLNPGMQYDADLAGTWTSATGTPGVVEVVTPNAYTTPTPADKVDVYVPRAGNAVSGKLFGRLRVSVP